MSNETPRQNFEGYVQCMSTAAIAAAVRGELDVVQMLRDELASRGLDTAGKWVGFPRAAELARVARTASDNQRVPQASASR